MVDGVKSTRKYRSPRRREQAAGTRQRIIEAAQRLFERDGYPSTTVAAVAAEAEVSLKTVYLVFATKALLLRALWDYLLKGDENAAGVADRAWYLTILAEQDPAEQLRLVGHASRAVKERIGPLLRVIRSAAPVDPDSADLWALIQSDFHRNQGVIVASLAEKGALRTGLNTERATDVLWALNHPDVWLLLVGERGWTPAEFEEWFVRTTREQLLGRVD